MLIESGEHDEGRFRVCAEPFVLTDNNLVRAEKHIVVGLLQYLCYGVEFAFVAAAVVRLRLALVGTGLRHGTDFVR